MTENGTATRAGVYALFAIVVLGTACGNLSQTAVNAMLGGVMGEFNMDVDLGQWLSTSYMLVLGVTVPAVTFLTRRLSSRQYVLLAFGFFLVGAVVDLFAPNFGVMLVGRILQAISTGMLMPFMQTLAMTSFPPGRQATAMGIAGVALGFAPNIGPSVGGAMSYALGWRSFFVLLVVLGLALGIATLLLVRRAEPLDRTAQLDVLSLVLSTLGFGGVLLGFSNASSYELTSPFIWAPLVLGAAILVWFVVRQRRLAHPLVGMDIFRDARFSRGLLGLCLLYGSYMGITLIVPLYVEDLCGGTALDAGMALLPGTVAALVVNPVAGILSDRFGARPVVVASGVFLAVGASLMVLLDETSPLWLAMVFQGIRAIGVSGMIGPLTSWSLTTLPRPIVADGSGFSIAVRQAVASFATSLMVFAITVGLAAGLGTAALPYHLAFGISAILAVATLVFVTVKVK